MADGGSRIKQFSEEVEQVTTEVAKDVKDSVGQALEQGVQTTFGPKLTPQQVQQKQLEEQTRLAKVRRDLKWYQDIAAAQKKERDEGKQKQLQKQQLEEQETQKKKMKEEVNKKRIISPAKRSPIVPGQTAPVTEEIARTRQEIGKGHGVGG
jgi:hypothetical protein